MHEKLKQAINEQIKNEFYSAYLYLAMAAYCASINLPGFAQWMKVQVTEEKDHAMKLYNFLIDQGQRVQLGAIAQPPLEFSSAIDVFQKTLEHEKKVTKMISDLYNLAQEVKDKVATEFLQWFVNEQAEEEESAAGVLAMFEKEKSNSEQLIIIDKELGERK